MKMTDDERYIRRRDFFNEHAEEWLDMWYKDRVTGIYDKHAGDFKRLFSLMPLETGDHVLDVGCGSGILVPFILERITSTGLLYELDFAEKMLDVNRTLHGQENIRFVHADAENAPLDDNSCDVVVCFSCFPHFHDKQKAVATLCRILRPGGHLVVSHFSSAEGINRHHGSCEAVMHDHLPDEESMRGLFTGAGLTVTSFVDEEGFYYISSTLTGR
ncbi:MAG: Demethylmenaquinone methyltransferase [Syntrophorhabdus sp. PtaB.Bin047]|jgi:demethylmenaquinone methyltransferase/2-methoxy-6-polyprenyl-1,4-benzoquinol methylase|nr:MAG: Demethylmenaquinone methyltransferase [Syntrophorhabdus sp. PtaB.Bin047]